MALITYKDKVSLVENPDIADENKVTAQDMNEIKKVVNENQSLTYDSLPVGSVIDFDGEEIPVGYEEVSPDTKILYSNNEGTNQSIQIPNINDYDYIDVLTSCNGYNNTFRIYKENYEKNNELLTFHISGGVFIIYCNIWKFTGTTFSRVDGKYVYILPNSIREIADSDHIKITKIIGGNL